MIDSEPKTPQSSTSTINSSDGLEEDLRNDLVTSATTSPIPEQNETFAETKFKSNALCSTNPTSPEISLPTGKGFSDPTINKFIAEATPKHKTLDSTLRDVGKQEAHLESQSPQKHCSPCLLQLQNTDTKLDRKTPSSTRSSTGDRNFLSPPTKPPRAVSLNSLEQDVLYQENKENSVDFRNVQNRSLDAMDNLDECDGFNKSFVPTKKISAPSMQSTIFELNDCRIVKASLTDVPKYYLLQDDSKRMASELGKEGKSREQQKKPLSQSKPTANVEVTQTTTSFEGLPAGIGDKGKENSLPEIHATLNSSQETPPHPANRLVQPLFEVRVNFFTHLDSTDSDDSENKSSSIGTDTAEQNREIESMQLENTDQENDFSNQDQVEQQIILPSVIAEARQRSQASLAYNRYVFISPRRSPMRKLDSNANPNWPNENSPFGNLQRKFRNSMRKIGSSRLKTYDPNPQSLILFMKNEEEYNEALEKIVACCPSYDSAVEDCLAALKVIKAASDCVIDYVSDHPLSVTTIVEAFYKQIDHFKFYATATKEMRKIEIASYEEERRGLGNLLEKLAVVNDRLPFYCVAFQTWLQIMPDVDNVAELRILVDLLEQIRLNGLIPD